MGCPSLWSWNILCQNAVWLLLWYCIILEMCFFCPEVLGASFPMSPHPRGAFQKARIALPHVPYTCLTPNFHAKLWFFPAPLHSCPTDL